MRTLIAIPIKTLIGGNPSLGSREFLFSTGSHVATRLGGEHILAREKDWQQNGRAMSKIPLMVLSALLGVLPSTISSAQTDGTPIRSVSDNSDEQIPGAPYSAKRHFTYFTKHADGTTSRDEASGSQARDSQGRTYSADERQWTYFDGTKNVLGSEMLYRIEDPVANTDTRWDATSKVVKVIHMAPSVPGDASKAQCPACIEAWLNPPGNVAQDLGNKTIGGFVAEGTRSSYTVPVGEDHNDQPIVVVHESWYCPELKIVILETNNDPRSGSSKDELIDIVRGEPDVTQYRPPANYAVREIQLP